MNDSVSHWYNATAPSVPDPYGFSIVGEKRVEVKPGTFLYFTILQQANGDFLVRCDPSGLAAANLEYRERTIYAPQAQAMPAQVIWSIILEGVVVR
ncbi:hypothetical protein [Spirosoma radiotolerans]|uniref:Uncharacterized protein n=1 Tax=Spirosoma radiotolerans TaxID=1379870 RepID=A0A0E3V5J7_9BACT|nr:hypothetical protein [Spirosoma radiotolerans]AKD54217.1 hypothetical protein SD10_04160 [Spirosoma radiotolerans]